MRNGMAFRLLVALGAAQLILVTPAFAKKHTSAKKKTLFAELGGKKAITKVVNDFVTRCAKDERIQKFFVKTASHPKRLAHFKASLVDQLCAATGGPCKYKGKDMRIAHRGMKISGADFDALVEDLGASLSKFKVPQAKQRRLLALLTPMRKQIVTAKPAIADVPPPARDTASEAPAAPAETESAPAPAPANEATSIPMPDGDPSTPIPDSPPSPGDR